MSVFAWNPRADSKTVVHGGFGVFCCPAASVRYGFGGISRGALQPDSIGANGARRRLLRGGIIFVAFTNAARTISDVVRPFSGSVRAPFDDTVIRRPRFRFVRAQGCET
jgi:hypothetical protein